MAYAMSSVDADARLLNAFAGNHKEVMYAIVSVSKRHGGFAPFEHVRNIRLVRDAIDNGLIGADLEELIHANKATWFQYSNGFFVHKSRAAHLSSIAADNTDSDRLPLSSSAAHTHAHAHAAAPPPAPSAGSSVAGGSDITIKRSQSGLSTFVEVFVPESRLSANGRLRMEDACRIIFDIVATAPKKRVLLANLGNTQMRFGVGSKHMALGKVLPEAAPRLSDLLTHLADKVQHDPTSRHHIILKDPSGTTAQPAQPEHAPSPAALHAMEIFNAVQASASPSAVFQSALPPPPATHVPSSLAAPSHLPPSTAKKGPPVPKVRTFPAQGAASPVLAAATLLPPSHSGASPAPLAPSLHAPAVGSATSTGASATSSGALAASTLTHALAPTHLQRPSSPAPAPVAAVAAHPTDDIFWPIATAGSHAVHDSARLLSRGDVDAQEATSYGLLGSIASTGSDSAPAATERDRAVYLNTASPYCLVAVGADARDTAGTLSVVLENHLLDCHPHIRADTQPTAVVFHYNDNPAALCAFHELGERRASAPAIVPVVDQTVVLVSPSYYINRKQHYAQRKNCTVLPLLFNWADLAPAQVKTLLRFGESSECQVYEATIVDMLRRTQKGGAAVSFEDFKRSLGQPVVNAQIVTLMQRLRLLECFLSNFAENQAIRGPDFRAILHSDTTPSVRRSIVVDLTDPMLGVQDVRAVFSVVLSMLAALPSPAGGKLAVFDGAHRYLDAAGDVLGRRIVSLVRDQRQQGVSVVMGSESAAHVPAEVLSLASVVVLHRFHARDCFVRLQGKLPLADADYDAIMSLVEGRAIVFALQWTDSLLDWRIGVVGRFMRHVALRARLTGGGSVLHDVSDNTTSPAVVATPATPAAISLASIVAGTASKA